MSRFDSTNQKVSIIIFEVMKEAWYLYSVGIDSIVEVARLMGWTTILSREVAMIPAFDLIRTNTLM